MNKEVLLFNIDKVHTTKMGVDRIRSEEHTSELQSPS